MALPPDVISHSGVSLWVETLWTKSVSDKYPINAEDNQLPIHISHLQDYVCLVAQKQDY